MKRKIYLDGELGEKYGRELSIVADSFVDVFRCLEANYPEIRQYLIECHEKGIGFLCEVAEKPLTTEEELLLGYPEGSMYICPQPMGASSGLGKIFAAIAIVAIMLTPGLREYFITTSLVAVGPTSATFAYSLTTAGLIAAGLAVNLALTGLMQIMAPDPATDANAQQDESYLFQGSGQTIVEGDPVPVLYGKLRVPGRPISFAVENPTDQFINISKSSVGASTPASNPAEGNPYDYTEGTVPAPIDSGRTPDAPGNSRHGGGGNIHSPYQETQVLD